MICAQEEDIRNEGCEARVRSEHRFPVDAYEPVGDRGCYPVFAIGEVFDEREFLDEPQEEPIFVAH